MACNRFNRKTVQLNLNGKGYLSMVGQADPLRFSIIFYLRVFNTKKKLLVDEILVYGIYIDEGWEEEERNRGYNNRIINKIHELDDHFCSRRQVDNFCSRLKVGLPVF